jgi:hypothetical protein
VEDQGVALGDVDQLGQVLEVLPDVDYPHGVVPEEPEVAVDVEVDRGRLDAAGAQRIDDDPPFLQFFTNGPV